MSEPMSDERRFFLGDIVRVWTDGPAMKGVGGDLQRLANMLGEALAEVDRLRSDLEAVTGKRRSVQPERDPLLVTRDIVIDRLQRDVPDEDRRWQIAVATSNQLDMAGLLVQPERRS